MKLRGLFLFLLVSTALGGQSLRIEVPDSLKTELPSLFKNFKPRPDSLKAGFIFFDKLDSTSVIERAEAIVKHFRQASYLGASIDTLISDSTAFRGRLTPGPRMRWLRIEIDSSEEVWIRQSGFKEKYFENKPLRYRELLRMEQQLLSAAENTGFPFARVWLDALHIDEQGGASARLRVDRNRFIRFAPMQQIGDVLLPKAYLPAYLGIRPGAPYNAAQVQKIRDRLRELPFLECSSDPRIRFAGEEAIVNVFLKKKKASKLDFILGLLPQPDATDGRLLITGSLNASFQNALSLGEYFSIELERLRPETQELETAAGIPYLLGLPVGVEGRLNVYRRDSSWVDANSELGLQYLFEGGAFLKLLWENRSSRLQTVDTARIINTRQLPANPDLSQNGFGLETLLNRLDYRFNPRNGWSFRIKGIAGFSTVRKNSTIQSLQDPTDPGFDFEQLYDTIMLRNTRWRGELEAQVFVPILERSTIRASMRSAGIFSSQAIYNNEQYRLGGAPNKLSGLRGFNEESLFASRFAVFTLEYRLLIGPNSFLAAFTDYGYLENHTNRVRNFQRPWGMGAGINLETRSGIFGISLAVGRSDAGQAFDFRAAKFHLGYVSLF
jgi:outer membrane protein assembly factor BamA